MFKKSHCAIFGSLFMLTLLVFSNAFCQSDEAEVQIMTAFKGGDYDLAIESAKKYLENNPNSVDILNLLGDAYLSKGDYLLAEEPIRKALELEPDNALSKKLQEQINIQKQGAKPQLSY